MSNTECVECKLNDEAEDSVVKVRIGTQEVLKKNGFKYLDSMIQSNGKIDDDIIHLIRVSWQK